MRNVQTPRRMPLIKSMIGKRAATGRLLNTSASDADEGSTRSDHGEDAAAERSAWELGQYGERFV